MYFVFLRFQSVDMDKNHSGEKWHLLGQHLVSSSSQWAPRRSMVLQSPSSYWTVVRSNTRYVVHVPEVLGQ